MLSDSRSPLSALNSLCNWRALPEVVEVLQLLRDKAEVARRLALSSPQVLRARDSGEVQMLRDQFIGNYKGLIELEQVLDIREAELRDILEQEKERATENNQPTKVA